MSGIAVADSSVLIALVQIGQIDLLGSLFAEVIAPQAVWIETDRHRLPDWIRYAECSVNRDLQLELSPLGQGEKEAITLAIEVSADWLLLDERAARRAAKSLGVPIVGTLGVILAAKRRGLVPAVRPLLNSLSGFGFRMSPDLELAILSAAGEAAGTSLGGPDA